MEETELVAALRNGDEGAYRILVDSYQTLILNCCFRFVDDKQSAEDLMQDVFVEVIRSIGAFRSQSKLSTWLYRIAVSKALDRTKRLNRRKRQGLLRSLSLDEESGPPLPASDLPDPQQVLEQDERRRILHKALDSLPESQRVAFTLSKYDALSSREIAEVLGTTVPAVESLIFRAKTNLQKRLRRYYEQRL